MDNRSWKRLNLQNVDVTLYSNIDGSELVGVVQNISEYGIGIFIPDASTGAHNFSRQNRIPFQFYDDISDIFVGESPVISADCIIAHAEPFGKGLYLGGTVYDKNYRQYYLHKELLATQPSFAAGRRVREAV